jgi:hypothetical protein
MSLNLLKIIMKTFAKYAIIIILILIYLAVLVKNQLAYIVAILTNPEIVIINLLKIMIIIMK